MRSPSTKPKIKRPRRPRSPADGPAMFDTFEEAVQLVRRMDLTGWGLYLAGPGLFAMALLYYVTYMSRSPFALTLLPVAALVMLLLYGWACACRAIFCQRLRQHALGEPLRLPGWSAFWRQYQFQLVQQSLGLLALPVSLLLAIPFAWTWAYFEHLQIVPLGTGPNAGAAARRQARQHAGMWPLTNHTGLLLVAFIGMVLYVNFVVLFLTLPWLLHIFTGWDSITYFDERAFLNSTFQSIMWVLTYLCLDPLLKAFYLLRALRAQAVSTGEDILARLATIRPAVGWLLLAGLSVLTLMPPDAVAQTETPAPVVTSPDELDRRLDDVLNRPEFSWRMPREVSETLENRPKPWLVEWVEKLRRDTQEMINAAREWWRRLWEEKRRENERREPVAKTDESIPGGADPGAVEWQAMGRFALVMIFFGLLAFAVYLLVRNRARLQLAKAETMEAPVLDKQDLEREDLQADALPPDEWLQLVEKLLAEGEHRLALRAAFLCFLARSAEHRWLRLARHKTNRDYERELGRRDHVEAGLSSRYRAAREVFEASWYGHIPATRSAVDNLVASLPARAQTPAQPEEAA